MSRLEAPHRLLVDLRPQFTGAFVPPDEELARWLCAYLERKSPSSAPLLRTGLPGPWASAIWTQLTGKTEAEHRLDAWSSGDAADVSLSILLGRETASGIRVPSIETTYANVSDVVAVGEWVGFRTKKETGSGVSIVVDVELGCSSASTARSLVAGIARREFRRLGRSQEVHTITAYYGEPWNSATLAGASAETEHRVFQEITRRYAPRAVNIRRSRARVFLFVS